MDFPCDHSHPAGISISSCLFRYEFYYVFSLCKSMLQTEILQKYLVIAPLMLSSVLQSPTPTGSPALTMISGYLPD